MSKLIFDIETIGDNFDDLDSATQETLTRWIKKDSENEEEYAKALDELKSGLGFSPLTGQIVAIGVLDYEKIKEWFIFKRRAKILKISKRKILYSNLVLKKRCWKILERSGKV